MTIWAMTSKHDRARTLAVGGLIGATAYWLPSASLVSATARRCFGVTATVEGNAVALTFDDGPHAHGTPAMLERLERDRVQATFFLAGEAVEREPALAAEVTAAGHAVGVHCHRHRNLMRLTPRQVRDDLMRARDVIESATGTAAAVYRPPYGILTTPALLHARGQGWRTVLWRRDGADWDRRATPDSVAVRILRSLAPGDVLLLHDSDAYSAPGSWQTTVAALPRIIERIRERGLDLSSL